MVPRTHVVPCLCLALLVIMIPARLAAQEERTPVVAADEFQRAMLGVSWVATADRMHADALSDFREHVRIMVDADGSGEFLRRMLHGRSREEMSALADAQLFVVVLEGMEREAPGLINSLVDRTYEVLGAIPDGPDRAHVVYRVAPRLTGDEPRVEVMTVADGPRGWRALRSDQIDALVTGLRGLPFIGRVPRPLPRDTTRMGGTQPATSSTLPEWGLARPG